MPSSRSTRRRVPPPSSTATVADGAGVTADTGRVSRRWALGLLLAASVVPSGLAVADEVPAVDVTDLRPIPSDRLEVIELECSAVTADRPTIACRWSIPAHPEAAGVRLVRVALGTGLGRTTVFRTEEPSQHTFRDVEVRPGVRYAYVVRVVSAAGHLVGTSRPAVAGVPGDRPTDVEVLRLGCRATSATAVACEWSAPAGRTRLLSLWRSVDGGRRERVASFGQPFPTSYGDHVPPGTARVVYTLVGTDGGDRITARSRATGVAVPDARPADRRPDREADRPARDVPSDRRTDVPSDRPGDVPSDRPSDRPSDVPQDRPADRPDDPPTDVPDEPTDRVPAEPDEPPAEVPADPPADPTDAPGERPDRPGGAEG